MKLSELLSKGKTVLSDGAFATFYSKLTGNSERGCELENINNPEIVKRIHTEYIKAGAEIIRTNTFSANTAVLNISQDKLIEVIKQGYMLAKESVNENTVVCADISAIYTNDDHDKNPNEEYRAIIDAFIECGADSFILETLPSIDTAAYPIEYIKSKKPDADIYLSFALMPDGFTRSGVSLNSLLDGILKYKDRLCAVGLNCGCGPIQIQRHAVRFNDFIKANTDLYTAVLPNSGYPYLERRRIAFSPNTEHFVNETARLIPSGINILGGCCGTEPEHIRLLAEKLKSNISFEKIEIKADKKTVPAPFSSRIANRDFVIAAELDPPYGTDLSKLINGANMLKSAGADIITISDSPLGQVKMEPVLCSSKIHRECGIDTLPHICCRDRNINALRSALLGAHSEGIRAVLAVTGDHIAESDRGIVKPVFNISSTQFMTIISEMNKEVFADSPILIGGAFNPDLKYAKSQLSRLKKKMDCGASFFLTQPVYSAENIDVIEEARSLGAKMLVGIMPLVSYRNASFLNNEVPGINIPQEIIDRFSPAMTREEGSKVGTEIAIELAKAYTPHADGFYFMTPFNRAEIVCNIIKATHSAACRRCQDA